MVNMVDLQSLGHGFDSRSGRCKVVTTSMGSHVELCTPFNLYQCSSDRSSGAKAISHQATTTPAALAAGSTPNHVQVGCTDVQGPDHINASVSESTHQVT